MRGAQAGAVVALTYQWWGEGEPPSPGDYLVSEAGSGYRILKARATSRLLRYRYQCEKVEPSEIPQDARVASLEWYRSEWGSKKRDQLDMVSLLSDLGSVEVVDGPPPVAEGPPPCVFCLEAEGHADWCVRTCAD